MPTLTTHRGNKKQKITAETKQSVLNVLRHSLEATYDPDLHETGIIVGRRSTVELGCRAYTGHNDSEDGPFFTHLPDDSPSQRYIWYTVLAEAGESRIIPWPRREDMIADFITRAGFDGKHWSD